MVYFKDSLRYQNVLSKRYYVDYKEVEDCVKSFCEDIKKQNVKIKGPIFYALHGFSQDGPVDIEIFAPTFSSRQNPIDMDFHSYYSVEQMASAKISGDFESDNGLTTMQTILMAINSFSAKATSPAYFIFNEVLGEPYITIKIGYAKDRDKEKMN